MEGVEDTTQKVLLSAPAEERRYCCANNVDIKAGQVKKRQTIFCFCLYYHSSKEGQRVSLGFRTRIQEGVMNIPTKFHCLQKHNSEDIVV